MAETVRAPAAATAQGPREIVQGLNNPEVSAAPTTTHGLRYRCRNPRCRMKLPAPTENDHHAFCCRGCCSVFYRSRCVVCERDISNDPVSGQRRCLSTSHRKFCGRKCRAEGRRYPHVYAWGVPEAVRRTARPTYADKTGLKSAHEENQPPLTCLAHWRWGGNPESGDYSLYNQDGLTVARVVLEADGRYHLRTPIAIPRQSWSDLDEAKRGAESFALMAISLAEFDPKLAARVAKDNSTPHPMGPPLNRPWPIAAGDAVQLGAGTKLAFKTGAPRSDDLDIPDFLRRAKP
jgi:hypothetical protein